MPVLMPARCSGWSGWRSLRRTGIFSFTRNPLRRVSLHYLTPDRRQPFPLECRSPVANMQRVVVARFRTESDADGYLKSVRRLIPDGQFQVIFDGEPRSLIP